MPSSPEARAWQPEELSTRPALSVAPAPTAPEFVADVVTPRTPALFEVASCTGVPERLLTEARSAAQASGYLAGWAAGLRAAEARTRAEAERLASASAQAEAERQAAFDRAVHAVDGAAASLEVTAVPGAAELEDLIVTAALSIAEELVGHAVRTDDNRAPATLARALSLTPADEDVVVRLSPSDHALLVDRPTPAGERTITLVADPSLAPGDAIAVSGATEVDARIRCGLDRVKAALGR